MTYQTASGDAIEPGGKLGGGGQGTVYKILNEAGWAAKIFKKPLDTGFVEKLEFMIGHVTQEVKDLTAWPEKILYKDGVPWGYTMPLLEGMEDLNNFITIDERDKNKYPQGWETRVIVAMNLATCFHYLHATGYVVADIKPDNILFKNGVVRVVDCDSFQVDTGKRVFYCPVGTGGYLAPELYGCDLEKTRQTIVSDDFALAVLIFRVLFKGVHPFAGRSKVANLPLEKKVAEFRYPYARDAAQRGCEPPLHAILPKELLPANMVAFFETAFTQEGLKKRPEALEWRKALKQLGQNLKPCDSGKHTVYGVFHDACPWCKHESGFADGEEEPIVQVHWQNTGASAAQPPAAPPPPAQPVPKPSASGASPASGISSLIPYLVLVILIAIAVLGAMVMHAREEKRAAETARIERLEREHAEVERWLKEAMEIYTSPKKESILNLRKLYDSGNLIAGLYIEDALRQPGDSKNRNDWAKLNRSNGIVDRIRVEAESNHPLAQAVLGDVYYIPLAEMTQDYNDSFRWYQKSALGGSPYGQFSLAASYFWGNGVEENDTLAGLWIRKAAEQKLAVAQYFLGKMYLDAQLGVPRDRAQAIYWLRKAADQGVPEAQEALRDLGE